MNLLAVALAATSIAPASTPPVSYPSPGWTNYPVTIQADPTLEYAAEQWNRLAGRTIFVVGDQPQVTIGYGRLFDAHAMLSWSDVANAACHVDAAPGIEPGVIVHELGHCLGAADHLRAGERVPRGDFPTPGRCSGAGRSAYVGIMSYCMDFHGFGVDDLAIVGRVDDRRGRLMARCLAKHRPVTWVCTRGQETMKGEQ